MPSYQIPQFLDSGEKIFLSLNIRQFAYLLAGFGLGVLLYSIFSGIFPSLGAFNLIFCFPCLPFAYLAFGKFNGRDSEVYVFKSFLYYTKPRLMKFHKQIDYSDLDSKMSEWTFDKVLTRWRGIDSQKLENQNSETGSFEYADASSKIMQIRNLAKAVNEPSTNVAVTLSQKTALVEQKKQLAEQIEQAQRQAKINARQQQKK
jgi:hypothetical protein